MTISNVRESWRNYHRANTGAGEYRMLTEEEIRASPFYNAEAEADLDMNGSGTGAFSRYGPSAATFYVGDDVE